MSITPMDVSVNNSLRDFDIYPPYRIVVTMVSPASLLQLGLRPRKILQHPPFPPMANTDKILGDNRGFVVFRVIPACAGGSYELKLIRK
jgi:hypothetical protein